jgi:5'-nucleotidase
MTGQQIYNVLNQQNYNGETRYLLISGMKLKYTETNSGANRYHVSEVIDNATGKPLDSNKRYNIVVNSFLHDGGDNFTEFRKAKLVDNQIGKDTDFLVQYIKDMSKDGNSLVAPTTDRKQKQ